MKISVVTTLYHSSKYIEEFVERSQTAAQNIADDNFEIILVDDGSPDNSLEIAVSLSKNNKNLKVIELSRNFGHHQAMIAGLRESKGDYVFLLDSDLEEEPEWLTLFYNKLKKADADTIYGQQKSRKGNLFEKISGYFYYLILNKVLHFDHPKNMITARLFNRNYLDAILRYEEREFVISGIWLHAGFKQIPIQIIKKSTSESSYTLGKKFSHLFNSITSFSENPLKLIFFTGLFISFCSTLASIIFLVRHLFFEKLLDGFTSTIISIWLLSGIIILFQGIIGLYLSKVFLEIKKRPLYHIKSIHKSENEIHS
jgi:putative glycosyltransferase